MCPEISFCTRVCTFASYREVKNPSFNTKGLQNNLKDYFSAVDMGLCEFGILKKKKEPESVILQHLALGELHNQSVPTFSQFI